MPKPGDQTNIEADMLMLLIGHTRQQSPTISNRTGVLATVSLHMYLQQHASTPQRHTCTPQRHRSGAGKLATTGNV